MEQRDYLMDQIEQLGRALGKILADLLQIRTNGPTDQGIEQAEVALQEKLDIKSLPELIHLSDQAFLDRLNQVPHLNPLGMERIADIFYEMGTEVGVNQKSYLKKSLAIYNYLMHRTRTFAFDWTEKIERINSTLQN